MKFLILFAILFASPLFASTLESKLAQKRNSSKAPPEVKEKMQKGVYQLIENKLDEKARALKGTKLPDEVFTSEIGMPIPLKNLYNISPLVINFYRGGWCPYCMLELQAYQEILPEFKKAGIQFISFAPDQYREINKTRKKFNLTFPMYSDRNNELSKKLNLAFKVDKDTLDIYKGFGIDLQAYQNNKEYMLPMPGVYIIDTKGVIREIFVDPDYTKRAEPSEVLKKAKALK